MLPFLRVILDRLPGGLWLILLISVMFHSITSYGCCALKHMGGGEVGAHMPQCPGACQRATSVGTPCLPTCLRQGLLLLLGIPVSVSDLAMGALELETYLEPSPQASL